MTSRQRGWLLPGAAVFLAFGILLGRISATWLSGAAALLCAAAAFCLLRGRGRFCACMLLALALGSVRGFFAFHPSLPPEGFCEVSGIVADEVRYRDNQQIRTSLTGITLDGKPFAGGAWWTFYSGEVPEGLEPGRAVSFTASLYHPSGALNSDGYDFREELLRRHILIGVYGAQDLQVSAPASFSLSGFAASVRHRLSLALLRSLGEETGAYASAMLLGNRTLLSREDRTAFSRLGIAHILSVSGFHVGILVGLLALLFRLLRLPQRLRLALYAAVLFFYSAICGWNQPVLRASLLVLTALGGRILNRPRPLLHRLSAAFILLLLLSPVQLTGLSFLLSFGAVLGLSLVTPWLVSLVRPKNRALRWIRNGLSAGAGAQLGILLPELYAFQELPLLALIINLPVLAYASLLIGLNWAVLLTLPLPGISDALCALTRAAASLLLEVVRRMGSLPGITLWTRAPGLLTCAGVLLLGAGGCVLFRWKGRTRALLAGCGTTLLVLSLIPLPHRSTEYFQLSVGNADGAVLWDRDSVWVLDAGYEDGVVSDFLHRRRLTPDGVILTHLHSDHVYGLKAMLEDQIPVRSVYLPSGATEADVHPDVLLLLDQLRAAGTEIRTLSAGDVLPLPSGEMTVLWPEKGKTRPGQDANESCLVLRLDLLGTSLLQAGDLDGRYEMYSAAPADILKIAHHGSAGSSSPEYLAAVAPQAALLSTGEEDRLASFSERLEGIPLYSTANHGMLTVRFEDHRFSIVPWMTVPPEGGAP